MIPYDVIGTAFTINIIPYDVMCAPQNDLLWRQDAIKPQLWKFPVNLIFISQFVRIVCTYFYVIASLYSCKLLPLLQYFAT